MIQLKSTLSKKDKLEISQTLEDLTDPYGDFYLTKEGKRLYIRENKSLLFSYLNKGNKIVYNEEGVAIITGYVDKQIKIYDRKTGLSRLTNSRKYVKILSTDAKVASDLIKFLIWHIKDDLFTKIKIKNPNKLAFLENGFKFVGGRGKEILLKLNKRGV